jgi:RNA polymerase sigma factor (sigma-70 family)
LTRKEYNNAVKEYSGRLNRYVVKCLKNEQDAQDVVQESFARLWQNRKKVENEKVKSWLFTTAHNTLINLAKKNSRTQSIDGADVKEPSTEAVNRFELREVIDKVLNQLPPLQKSIILLRDLEGYDYKEIGRILDLTESQVKVYLFRGRQKIKNEIKDLTILS